MTAQVAVGIITLIMIIIAMFFIIMLQFKCSEQNARRLEGCD